MTNWEYRGKTTIGLKELNAYYCNIYLFCLIPTQITKRNIFLCDKNIFKIMYAFFSSKYNMHTNRHILPLQCTITSNNLIKW